jgi:hypothetical protein
MAAILIPGSWQALPRSELAKAFRRGLLNTLHSENYFLVPGYTWIVGEAVPMSSWPSRWAPRPSSGASGGETGADDSP